MSRRHHNYHHSVHVQHARAKHAAPHADSPEAPHETVTACPFGDVGVANPQTFDAGALLTNPDYAGLVGLVGLPKRDMGATGVDASKFGSEHFGCLELHSDGKTDKKKALSTIPSINDMVENARGLRRIATGDSTQPEFAPYEKPKTPSSPIVSAAATPVESGETTFKRKYVAESLALGEKRGISKDDMKRILLGIYSIEGFGRIPYDMQSGTSFKYSAADQPGSTINEDARRLGVSRISSAVGYNQITFPANLHLLHDDHGAIPDRLRELAKAEENKPGGRAEELKQKAQLTEDLQGKLHDELLKFAQHDPRGKSLYMDRNGQLNAKAYYDFSKSNDPTSFGMSGKEFTTGLHALLLDSDVGPILQARQLDEDIEQTLRPEFQKYLDAKTVSSKAAAKAIENLLADAACKNLTKKQLSELTNQWDKLGVVPDITGGVTITDPGKNVLQQEVEKFGKSPLGLMFQKAIPTIQYGSLAPAGAMACNLAGPDSCRAMFEHSQSSTRNFMSGAGYRLNPVLHGATVDQFLHRLTYQMSQKRGPGTAEFQRLFEEQTRPGDQPK